ncbi:carbohydrate ABC transporter permease [Calidithermus timidus]|jgi:multiple sugar transport system permease protein|uniref:carbohydrate ABC transporter permease n=1 Tax=Calidithermus timidus TaxID=307124 RepID=UPI00037F5D21|nr:carbohydrate ABC transporter permease [Calidithermus timidus]
MSNELHRSVRGLARALHYLLSLAVAGVFLLPLWWVLVASLRPLGLPPSPTLEWLPNLEGWRNYVRLFETVPLAKQLYNSLFVELFAVPLTVLTASWAGFATALSSPPLQRRLVILALLLMLVPSTALWLTRFLLFKNLGLIDTPWALIAPAIAGSSSFYVLLFFWSFRRIPREMLEAARLDGAGVFMLWLRIAMPLARPTSISVAILAFSYYWSDLSSPLLYLRSEEKYTLPVGLQVLQQMDPTSSPLLMAAAVVMLLPVLLLFLILQHSLGFSGQLLHDWTARLDAKSKK